VRALAVAVELRRLRMQQQRQRVVGGMAPGDLGMSPWVMAWRPRAWRRSRRFLFSRSGVRHRPRTMVHASIAATMAMPSASANTDSDVSTRQPPHDSTTSPG